MEAVHALPEGEGKEGRKQPWILLLLLRTRRECEKASKPAARALCVGTGAAKDYWRLAMVGHAAHGCCFSRTEEAVAHVRCRSCSSGMVVRALCALACLVVGGMGVREDQKQGRHVSGCEGCVRADAWPVWLGTGEGRQVSGMDAFVSVFAFCVSVP